MKKRIISLCLALCMVLALVPVTAFAAEDTVTVLVAGCKEYAMAGQVAELVNEERAAEGRAELTWNAELTEMAMLRAAEIALFYGSSHERPDGTECFTVLDGTDFAYGWAGENIAAGQWSAETVMEDWMNSDGHRANILDSHYTQIGVGSFTSGRVTTWVQIFSSVKSGEAVTGIPDRTQTVVEVNTLTKYLDTPNGKEKTLNMELGESLENYFTNTNQGFPYMKTNVVPMLGDITDGSGKVIARTHWQDKESEGVATMLTAVGAGTAVWKVRMYDGQDPIEIQTIHVIDSSLYSISIDANEGGLVRASAAEGHAGDQVTLTVRPDEGYVVSQLSVTEGGRDVPLTRQDDVTYTFTMPSRDVEIHVRFWLEHEHDFSQRTLNGGWVTEICSICGGTNVFPIAFDDLESGRYYVDGVLWALFNGITEGVSETKFAPDADCTRGQVVTFLWRAAGCPEPTVTEHPFTDVKEGAYYYKAMLWAVENGVTKGLTETTFGPGESCTRGQVVTFLHRAMGSEEPASYDHSFVDVKESAYYYQAMLWAVEEGITSGMTTTTFVPDGTCTRGQIVTFLYRAFAE